MKAKICTTLKFFPMKSALRETICKKLKSVPPPCVKFFPIVVSFRICQWLQSGVAFCLDQIQLSSSCQVRITLCLPICTRNSIKACTAFAMNFDTQFYLVRQRTKCMCSWLIFSFLYNFFVNRSRQKSEKSDGPGFNGWTRLKRGDKILCTIAQHFTELHPVIGLATELLHGVGQGGYSFVQSLTASGGVPAPNRIAHSVLEEWCTQRPEESIGARLFAVLHKVLPSAALEFKDQLLLFSGSTSDVSLAFQIATE